MAMLGVSNLITAVDPQSKLPVTWGDVKGNNY